MGLSTLEIVVDTVNETTALLGKLREDLKESVIDADFGPEEQLKTSAGLMYLSRRLAAAADYLDDLRPGDDEDD